MNKHTPGPWKWNENELQNEDSPTDYDSILNHNADWKINESNKALISAAPDMLEAIRALLGCTELNLDDLDQTSLDAIENANNVLKQLGIK